MKCVCTKKSILSIFICFQLVDDDEGDSEEDDDADDGNKNLSYEEYTKRKEPVVSALDNELLYLHRVKFILLYHIALTVYMQKQFTDAYEVLDIFEICMAVMLQLLLHC